MRASYDEKTARSRQHHSCKEVFRLNVILLQQFDAMHSAVKGTPTRTVNALGIMNMPWPIQTDTDLYIVPLDKITPVLIDQI
jgi:hypothetical protein